MMEFKAVSVVVMAALAVALLGTFVSEVDAVFDPAPQYDGYLYPEALTFKLPILLEAFNDPMCPDSKRAWPVMKEVVSFYGDKLVFIIHEFPVPFHRNSFIASRAMHIANNWNASVTIPFLDLIYENQDSLNNTNTYSQTPENVTQTIIGLAVQAGVPKYEMAAGFSIRDTDLATRASFKFICSRYITSTPSYSVNGALMAADETWTVDQWKQYLDPLIASS